MSSSISTFPVGFSWLSPACRPSAEEVNQYAAVIAAREGASADQAEEFRTEAELQLWVWHNETRHPPRRRRSLRLASAGTR